jgi:hypothetical protein
MSNQKISDLSVTEFKTLIRETMIETLESFGIPEVDNDEQREREGMSSRNRQISI